LYALERMGRWKGAFPRSPASSIGVPTSREQFNRVAWKGSLSTSRALLRDAWYHSRPAGSLTEVRPIVRLGRPGERGLKGTIRQYCCKVDVGKQYCYRVEA